MSDVFVTPVVGKLAPPYNGWFACSQQEFALAPLGGMSSQRGVELVSSPWVAMPCPASALDLALAVTALVGLALTVTVLTCRAVVGGNPVDAPRAATGGAFASQSATGTVYAQCLVLQWVQLQIQTTGVDNGISAFTVTGTGVPLDIGGP